MPAPNPLVSLLARLNGRVVGDRQVIVVDYPTRWRRLWDEARPHPELADLLASGRERYRAQLAGFAELAPFLTRIPADGAPPGEPVWVSPYLPGLDGLALYGLVAEHAPRRYVEVGSGSSTRFVRRAIADHGLSTRIVSIDPHPRAEIDAICDEVHRSPLEDVDQRVFAVEPGDVVFLDGSHRCLPGSDVTVFFLEILPRLPAGTIVQVHDVCLPFDYPDDMVQRAYSEQYLLAADLLARRSADHVLLPNAFVSADRELAALLAPVWDAIGDPRVVRGGSSFWFRTV